MASNRPNNCCQNPVKFIGFLNSKKPAVGADPKEGNFDGGLLTSRKLCDYSPCTATPTSVGPVWTRSAGLISLRTTSTEFFTRSRSFASIVS